MADEEDFVPTWNRFTENQLLEIYLELCPFPKREEILKPKENDIIPAYCNLINKLIKIREKYDKFSPFRKAHSAFTKWLTFVYEEEKGINESSINKLLNCNINPKDEKNSIRWLEKIKYIVKHLLCGFNKNPIDDSNIPILARKIIDYYFYFEDSPNAILRKFISKKYSTEKLLIVERQEIDFYFNYIDAFLIKNKIEAKLIILDINLVNYELYARLICNFTHPENLKIYVHFSEEINSQNVDILVKILEDNYPEADLDCEILYYDIPKILSLSPSPSLIIITNALGTTVLGIIGDEDSEIFFFIPYKDEEIKNMLDSLGD